MAETALIEHQVATPAEMRTHVNRIQEVMSSIMKPDTHYGKIPYTDKPTLYKAGSEVLLTTFRIAVDRIQARRALVFTAGPRSGIRERRRRGADGPHGRTAPEHRASQGRGERSEHGQSERPQAAEMSVQTSRCRSCDDAIVWMETKTGRRMPVNADSVDEADLEWLPASPGRFKATPLFDPDQHESHFATCPEADTHRRK